MKIKYVKSKDKRVEKFNSFIEEKFPHFLHESNPDIILVAGGDGAMHHAVYNNQDFEGVFFGKAMGTLNFLLNDIEDDIKVIRDLEGNKIELAVVETRAISVYLNDRYLGEAINDVILGEYIDGYKRFNICSKDRSFNNLSVRGGGLCISTPLGSTAFNFNNGGLILPLNSNLWSLTGIVCNRVIRDILEGQELTVETEDCNIYISGINKGKVSKGSILKLLPGKTYKLGFIEIDAFLERRVRLANRLRME